MEILNGTHLNLRATQNREGLDNSTRIHNVEQGWMQLDNLITWLQITTSIETGFEMFVWHLPHIKCFPGSGDSLTCGLGLGPEEKGDVQLALYI